MQETRCAPPFPSALSAPSSPRGAALARSGPPSGRDKARWRAGRLLAAALAAALTGCGGVFIGIGTGGDDDGPQVDLIASPSTVSSGGNFELQASVRDASPIDEVRFYEVIGSARDWIGVDRTVPYTLRLQAPVVGATTVFQYEARAWDVWNNRGGSAVVSVTVVP